MMRGERNKEKDKRKIKVGKQEDGRKTVFGVIGVMQIGGLEKEIVCDISVV